MKGRAHIKLILTLLMLTCCAGTKPMSKGNMGYRVQICFTESLEEAKNWHHRVEAELKDKPYRVYTVYEAPYYKVRVGDFLQPEDAYQLRAWLINELGYSDAWVVPSEVVINQHK